MWWPSNFPCAVVQVNVSCINENLFFLPHIKCSRISTGKKKRTGVLGGWARQIIGRVLAILIQLPEPYLSHQCGRISPPSQQQKKDNFLFANSKWISSYVCMFTRKEATAIKKKSSTVCKATREGFDGNVSDMLEKPAELFVVCVPWWEHIPEGFYHSLKVQFKRKTENLPHSHEICYSNSQLVIHYCLDMTYKPIFSD